MSAALENTWLSQVPAAVRQAANQPVPMWLAKYRDQALSDLVKEPLPGRKQEGWRYTPTDKLLKQPFSFNSEPTTIVSREEVEQWFTPGLEAIRLVFVDGIYQPELVQASQLPSGVVVSSFQQALQHVEQLEQYLGQASKPVGPQPRSQRNRDSRVFELANQATVGDGLYVHLQADTTLELPVEVVYLSTSGDKAIQPRSLVVLEAGASMTLIEKFAGQDDASGFCNNQLEVMLEARAAMTHYRLQQEATQAFHRGGVDVRQAADSHYDGAVFSLGASWSRTEIGVGYRGEGAKTRLQGVQLAADRQVNDIHLDIQHNLPGCHSEENFRGLLHGAGKVVFDGRIVVDRDAQKTEAYLSNNNLMLSREAEVDTKPQLEIYADDVKCSHGTTIGEIDPNQVFYLRSRGLSEARARVLLSMGFVAQVVEQVSIEPLREELLGRLENSLASFGV